MNRPTIDPRRILRLLPALALAACLFDRDVAGGTSETSNGDLVARVLYADGRPAAGVRALVVDQANWEDKVFRPGAVVLDSHRTDASGKLRFKVPECTRCNLQIDGAGEGKLLRDLQDLRDRDAGKPLELELSPYGIIEGPILSDSVLRVLLVGTTYEAEDLDRGYRFPAVPEGSFTVAALIGGTGGSGEPGGDSVQVRTDSVTVEPGSKTDGPTMDFAVTYGKGVFGTWPRWKTIPIEFPAGYADSPSTFPLLVRLDGSNFDFRRGGRKDLRFSDTRGQEMAHAIVSWDSAGESAEVWVETLYRGLRRDTLTMLWGKPGTHETSASHRVFTDYASVWHMDSKPLGNNTFEYDDAARGGNELRASAATSVQGVVGNAVRVQGSVHLSAPHDTSLRPAEALTITAWVRFPGGEGNMDVVNQSESYTLRVTEEGFVLFMLRDQPVAGSDSSAPETWTGVETSFDEHHGTLLDGLEHHVAAVFDGDSMWVYLDGEPKISAPRPGRLYYPGQGEIRVGAKAGGCRCTGWSGGDLDEVRIAPRAFSHARLRYEFRSQRLPSHGD